jgi:hypothetical protein
VAMSIENCHCPPFGAKALVCVIGAFVYRVVWAGLLFRWGEWI